MTVPIGASGKIVAMAARSVSRDLYDAWRLLHAEGPDWKHVKLATLAIGAAIRMTNASEPLEDASLRNLASPKPEACIRFGFAVMSPCLKAKR
jgi:hypothetical protein